MNTLKSKTSHWLKPLAWIYGLGVWLRGKCFDAGWIRTEAFGLPVICIGNLTVGGTGKTPHTEYLIRLLGGQGLNVAALSRGYRRKTKGYILAGTDSDAAEIGDEPCQMKTKFPELRMAVDENRRHGIRELMKLTSPPVDVVVMDDAFQHRQVRAGLNILLADYHRLPCDDCLLPAGRLREPFEARKRAQVVVVTKCPEDIKPIDFNIIAKKMDLQPWQELFFTGLTYGDPQPVFPTRKRPAQGPADKEWEVLVVTGIAQPQTLVEEIGRRAARVEQLHFGDHHEFSRKDFRRILQCFARLDEKKRIIITTEKDAARLKRTPLLPEQLKPWLYAMPIEVKVLQNRQQAFNQTILNYVRKNPRNRVLPQGEDAHKA